MQNFIGQLGQYIRKNRNFAQDSTLYNLIIEMINIFTKDITVTKRNGVRETVDYNEIVKKFQYLCSKKPELLYVNPYDLALKLVSEIRDGIPTAEIDQHAANIAKNMTISIHYHYEMLAARLIVDNLQRAVLKKFPTFSAYVTANRAIFAENLVKFAEDGRLDSLIDHERDFQLSYEGILTLKKSYLLLDTDGEIMESPQYMWMRVAATLCSGDIEETRRTYDAMSHFEYTHATPTLFSAGLKQFNGISCYLQALPADSVEGIGEMFKRTMLLQKSCGGVGTHIHNLRANGSMISSSNRECTGIVKPIQILESIAQYIDQNRKRPGSNAIYIEPWHREIMTFLDMMNPHGDMAKKAIDLFYALWIPDLFFKRVQECGDWYLMCPHEYPGLSDVYGEEFDALYEKYVRENADKIATYSADITLKPGMILRIPARELWEKVIKTQIESGKPYLLAKDRINERSNQKNIGIIKSSNLCAEICLYSDATETATCCLASIKVSSFWLRGSADNIDWDKLREVVKLCTRNLNRVLDLNDYPTPETRKSSLRHRAIGIGIQDLHGLFMKMRLPFTKAREVNRKIQQFIYYHALSESCRLAEKYGPYETFAGSPASQGILQPDYSEDVIYEGEELQWDLLRKNIIKYGLRNSQLLANMPTASTATILGSTVEGVEPLLSNLYSRKLLTGEFAIVNRYLVDDLARCGLWNRQIKDKIIQNYGQIGKIEEIPEDIRELYATVREFGMKPVVDMYADRGHFVCQSQSMNVFPKEEKFQQLHSIYMYAFKRGLKTLCYYMRGSAAHNAQQNIMVGDDNECLFCSS